MKLLIVSNMWPSTADPVFGVFVRQQVEDLRAIDPALEVEVFAFDARSSKRAYLRAVLRLRRRLAREGDAFDLIHAHYVLSGLVALLAGARRHAPLAITHHGIEVFEGWQAPLARWVSRRADKTFVISRAMAQHLGLGEASVLPCGIDLRRFHPGPREAARETLGLPAPPVPIIAWVGVDRPEKRLWLARAAVEKLRADPGFSDAQLHIVEGQAPAAVPLHLQAADLVLVTSTREGGPLVVKEALAVGRPVVSVAVGDVAEVLEGMEACHVVPNRPDLRHPNSDPDASEALAALLALAMSKALRSAGDTDRSPASLNASARLSRYDAMTIARRLRRAYADLVGEAREDPAASEPAAPKTPLRILVIRQGSFPEDPRVRREVEALLDRGHEVDIICLRRKGEGGRERWRGVRIHRMPLQHRRGGTLGYLLEYGLFFGMAMLAASLLHLRRRYHLVQVNTMPDVLVFAAWLPRMMGARVLLDFHELMPELYASKFASGLSHPLPRLLARIETRAAGWADACLAVSEPCLDAYTRRGAAREHFTIVMNAADPKLFAKPARSLPSKDDEATRFAEQAEPEGLSGPPASSPSALSAEESDTKPATNRSRSPVPVPAPAPAPAPVPGPAPTAPIRVVSHGTLAARYGFDLLIQAVARIRTWEEGRRASEGATEEATETGPPIVLDILGEGDARPELESLIERLGLQGWVALKGFVPLDEVAGHILAADIGVVANRSDPFTDLVVPTKLMEYASLGIPAVAARTPAVEAYFDERMVRFFPPGDVDALAEQLLAMASDARLRADLAEGAGRFVARHGWPVQAARYVALIERLSSSDLPA